MRVRRFRVTHVFVGSVGPHQRPVQTGLHVVDLLVILRKQAHFFLFFSFDTTARLPRRVPKRGTRKTHRDDVEEVVISQRVQDGGDGLSGDGQPEALHAAAHVHKDHHILGGRGGLDVPESGGTFMVRPFWTCPTETRD